MKMNKQLTREESIANLDKYLAEKREMIIRDFIDNGESIHQLSLHNILQFQDGNFTHVNKGDKFKLQISFSKKQFGIPELKGLPRKSEEWRLHPLVLLLWKDEIREDEK